MFEKLQTGEKIHDAPIKPAAIQYKVVYWMGAGSIGDKIYLLMLYSTSAEGL